MGDYESAGYYGENIEVTESDIDGSEIIIDDMWKTKNNN